MGAPAPESLHEEQEEVLYPAVIVLGEYVKLKLEATLELNQ